MNILDLLKQTGALLIDGHYVYTSGKHGPVYINKDLLYTHTEKASEVGKAFAEKVQDLAIDVVAAPALGGIILSQWTAYHLSKIKGHEVLSVYTEKSSEGGQNFTRGYERFINSKNVFVVEDMTSTGGSVKRVVRSVREAGGNVLMTGVMVDRSPDGMSEQVIGSPFFALGRFPVQLYEERGCVLCKENVPINTDAGHGKEYLKLKSFSQKISKRK